MECSYKQGIIDLYSDNGVIDYLNENSSDDIFEDIYGNLFLSKDRKPTHGLYAFENYFIKYYYSIRDENLKRKCEDIINNLYNCLKISNITNTSMLSEASSLFKSTLTRTNYLNTFADEGTKKEVNATKQALLKYGTEYIKKFNIYFDKKIEIIKSGASVYNNKELKALELTDEEKKIMLNLFAIQKINTPDSLEWVEEAQEKYFVSLIADPYESTRNISEQEFLTFYSIRKFFLKRDEVDPELSFEHIYDKKNLGGFAKGTDYITVNLSADGNVSNLDLVQTACHEAEHIAQSKRNYKNNLNDSLAYQYMIRMICSEFPQECNITENRENDIEGDENYKYTEIELDSEKKAFFKLRAYISDYLYPKYSLDTTKLDHRIDLMEEHVKERFSPFMAKKILNKQIVPVYHYNMIRMKEIVEKHPELIEKWSVLELLYDSNGKMKNIEDVLKSEPIENQMIIDYILEAAINNELSNIDINDYSDKEKCNLFSNLDNSADFELEKFKSFAENPELIEKEHNSAVFIQNILELFKIFTSISSNMIVYEENDLALKTPNKIKSILNILQKNEKKILNLLGQPALDESYGKLYDAIKSRIISLNETYDNIISNKIFKRRADYIVENNIIGENENIIANIVTSILPDSDFYNFLFNYAGKQMNVNSFLNDYVKYSLIDGKIIDFYGNEVIFSELFNSLYQEYLSSKGLNNNDEESEHKRQML